MGEWAMGGRHSHYSVHLGPHRPKESHDNFDCVHFVRPNAVHWIRRHCGHSTMCYAAHSACSRLHILFVWISSQPLYRPIPLLVMCITPSHNGCILAKPLHAMVCFHADKTNRNLLIERCSQFKKPILQTFGSFRFRSAPAASKFSTVFSSPANTAAKSGDCLWVAWKTIAYMNRWIHLRTHSKRHSTAATRKTYFGIFI